MKRSLVAGCLVTAAAVGVLLPASVFGQDASSLAGIWSLNRSLSELPREIGFNLDWVPPPGDTGQSPGSNPAGRGRRGGGGGGSRGPAPPFSGRRESYEDSQRVQLLTAEARNPPARLTVVDGAAAVTLTNDLGQSRVFHPDGTGGGDREAGAPGLGSRGGGAPGVGKEESIDIQGVSVRVTTKRDGDRLIVFYHAEQDRDIRYTYSRSDSPSQLIVEIQFLEHGDGDKARWVYEPGVTTSTSTPANGATASSERARLPGTQGAPGTPAPPASAAPPGTPASAGTPANLDTRPGAELRGLKSLGILVEDLSAQAVACGLNHDAIESALTRQLTDAGFSVRRNSDEDTYLYVNVMTTSVSGGTCVSRYDAFLYTQAPANLSYRNQPVLAQVSLLHRGGIGSSAPVGHAAAVTRGLENFVDLFVTQIRGADK